jgi:hypothetical protein
MLQHLDIAGADSDAALVVINTLDGIIAGAQAFSFQCIQQFVEQRFSDVQYAAGEIAMELTWPRRHTESAAS